MLASTRSPSTDSKSTGPGTEKSLQEQLESTSNAFENATNSALLPMGWNSSARQYVAGFFKTPGRFEWSTNWFLGLLYDLWALTFSSVGSLAGWLLTGMAISLGAPFWFDTLNKFMVGSQHGEATGEEQGRAFEALELGLTRVPRKLQVLRPASDATPAACPHRALRSTALGWTVA